VALEEAVRVADGALPDLLTPFLSAEATQVSL